MRHNLPSFEHWNPQSVEEACNVLSKHQEKASAVGGGTDLLVRMKYRASAPRFLVNLKKIPNLSCIEEQSDGAVVIGALARLHDIEVSPLIQAKYPILSQAVSKVANRTIRNMATLGGNLCQDARCEYYIHSHVLGFEYWPKCFKRGGDICHIMKKGDYCYARYSADTAPALIALGANVIIASLRGERSISLEKFYTGNGHPVNILQPDEILSAIHIRPLHAEWKGVYVKQSYRKTTDYPIVGVAALADMKGDLCRELKLVVVSVASTPVRMREVEDTLKGVRLSGPIIDQAGEMAMKAVHPVPHHGDSANYVREMVRACTQKALLQLLATSSSALQVDSAT